MEIFFHEDRKFIIFIYCWIILIPWYYRFENVFFYNDSQNGQLKFFSAESVLFDTKALDIRSVRLGGSQEELDFRIDGAVEKIGSRLEVQLPNHLGKVFQVKA